MMYKKLLSIKFFEDNPYEPDTVQQLIYSILMYEKIEDMANEFVMENDSVRAKKAEDEKRLIESETEPKCIIKWLRKGIDSLSSRYLIQKALKYEDAIISTVVDMFMRSINDVFIENTIRLLSKSKENYAERLRDNFNEIRSTYAQSLTCLILGFRGDEEMIPWMYDKYFELKNKYPYETYADGALFALFELDERFYKNPKGRKENIDIEKQVFMNIVNNLEEEVYV